MIEEKRKHAEANARASTLSRFQRIAIGVLTHDSKPAKEVIVKSSRATGNDGTTLRSRARIACMDVRPDANGALRDSIQRVAGTTR